MYRSQMCKDTLATFLTEKIAVLMWSYDQLLENEPSKSNMQKHRAWNAACKAAAAHIEILARMVRQIDRAEGERGSEDAPDAEWLAREIAEARAEIGDD